MIRRTFLAASAAALINPSVARAQAPATIRIATAADEDAVACLYAQQSGVFKRSGLEVSLTASSNGAAISAAVAGGSIDVGKASLIGLIAAHARGIPFTIIAPSAIYTSEARVTGTIVKSDSPIKTARDLTGKTVSVQSLKGILQLVTMNWIDTHGGDSSSVHYLELPPTSVYGAVMSGRVDAATFTNPLFEAALATKQTRVLAWSSDALASRYMQACYFCMTDYATKNADTVARFARAIGEASAYTNAHHAETVDMVAKFTGVPAEEIAHMTRVTCGIKPDPRDVQPLIDVAAKYAIIPARFDARDIIDPAVLR